MKNTSMMQPKDIASLNLNYKNCIPVVFHMTTLWGNRLTYFPYEQ